MRWEQPEARSGRTAVFLLVVAIFVATALAIALVVGVASQSSRSSDDVLVLGRPVTRISSGDPEARPVAGPVVGPVGVARAPEAPIVASATISVPEIELDTPVYEGVGPSVLDTGPGHRPGTAAPGGYGNLVIAGHRSTSARSFARIGELAPGDLIIVGDITGSYTYVVDGSDVAPADRVDVVQPPEGHTLTLIAPHPPGSERYRYVVHARLLSTPRPPGV